MRTNSYFWLCLSHQYVLLVTYRSVQLFKVFQTRKAFTDSHAYEYKIIFADLSCM